MPPASWSATSEVPVRRSGLVVHAGAGAYICGEETALLSSPEGRRGQPRIAGGRSVWLPAVINNVERDRQCPSIILGGIDWFRSMGSENRRLPAFAVRRHRPGHGRRAPLGHAARDLLGYAGGVRAGHRLRLLDAEGATRRDPLLTEASGCAR